MHKLAFCTRVFLILDALIIALPPHAHSLLVYHSRCTERCDNHRPKGLPDAFRLDCNNEYHTSKEQQYCSGDCFHCPDSVCDGSRPNIFNCPSTDLGNYESCQVRCEARRPFGEKGKFTFKCDRDYHDRSDIQNCQADCENCPHWICNQHQDSNTYYCPVQGKPNYDLCYKDCDYHRKRKYGDGKDYKFQFHCTEFSSSEETQCRKDCRRCPKTICDADEDDNEYNCPGTITPTTTTTTPKPGYGGRCKQRCDKFRLGGTESYWFSCSSLFSTNSEQEKCQEDCRTCPADVCYTDYQFNCPESDYHKEKVEMRERQVKETSGLLVAAIVIAVLMTIGCIIATCCYCSKRRAAVQPVVASTSVMPMQTPMASQYSVGTYPYQQPAAQAPPPYAPPAYVASEETLN